jgi:CheY-like chemotaxis protein
MQIDSSPAVQTILIVDDDPALIVAWGRLLRLKSFRVATARDAEAGLAAATDLRPALIITDRGLPGMDGIEFCRVLKRNPRLAEIPVVLASAGETPILSEPLWNAFWQKPVPADLMLVTITRLLAGSR